MTIKICPHCNARYLISKNIGDYIHDCSQTDVSDALRQDDVAIIGGWEDFDGSGTKPAQEVNMQGVSNELQGTRAGVLGYNEDATTARGLNAKTHRQRTHFEYIDLKEEEEGFFN